MVGAATTSKAEELAEETEQIEAICIFFILPEEQLHLRHLAPPILGRESRAHRRTHLLLLGISLPRHCCQGLR